MTSAAPLEGQAVALEGLGDVAVAAGRLGKAGEHYEARHAIAERLAAADPGHAGWQRDLIVSSVKLAEVATQAGRTDEARERYARALAIAQNLAATGRLAPVDAWMPAELEKHLARLPR